MTLSYPAPTRISPPDSLRKYSFTVNELPDIILDFGTVSGFPEEVWSDGTGFKGAWAQYSSRNGTTFDLACWNKPWNWDGSGIGFWKDPNQPQPAPDGASLPDGWHLATDYGAVGDGTTDNNAAMGDLLEAAAGGGLVLFPDPGATYGIDGLFRLTGDAYSGIHFMGPGTLQHLTSGPTGVGSFGHPDYLVHLLRDGTTADGTADITVRDMNLRGVDTADNVVIFAADGRRLRFLHNNFGPGGREGIAQHNTDASSQVFVIGNLSEGVGSEYGVAPYTHNANQVVMIGNIGMNSGACVEQTGVDCVAVGNVFNTSDYSGMGMHSSTYNNSRMAVVANVMAHTNHGILITELTQSVGRSIVASNVVYNSKCPFTVGAAADQVVYLHGNYTQAGSTEEAAIVVGHGKSVIANNIIDHCIGTCTVTTTSGSTAISVSGGSPVDEGTVLTIPGVTGTKRVVRQRGYSIPAIGLDVNSPCDATVSNVTATYETPKWPCAIRCVHESDLYIRDNYFFGIPWSAIAIQMTGITARLEGNVFDPRGQTYGVTPILQVWDSLRQFFHGELMAGDFDVTKPWAYGGAKIGAKQYLHATRAQGAPSNLTWRTGDEIIYTDPVAGGHRGLVCVQSGTAGFCGGYSSTGGVVGVAPTGAISSGSTQLVVSSARGFVKGCYITIAGVTGIRRVVSLSGTTLTLDSAADATVAGAVVGYSAPVWKTFGSVTL